MVYWEQKIVKMYRIALLLFSSIITFNCQNTIEQHGGQLELPYYNSADFTPHFISNPEEIEDSITHRISDFSFLNQDSATINEKDIEGKVHIANFIFTSCISICPDMTSNMKKISHAFKDSTNVVLLSYSVMPWRDSPSVLKKYKENENINNENWHFLTGSKSDIYNLARTSYFAEQQLGYSKDSSEFLHTEHFVLVDDRRRIRGIYNGTLSLEMDYLIEDIKNLLGSN